MQLVAADLDVAFPPLVQGRFFRRLSRFHAEVEAAGRPALAHLPNSGRLHEALVPGGEVLLARRTGARRTAFDLLLARLADEDCAAPRGDGWACLDARLPARILAAAVERGAVPRLAGLRTAAVEPRLGAGPRRPAARGAGRRGAGGDEVHHARARRRRPLPRLPHRTGRRPRRRVASRARPPARARARRPADRCPGGADPRAGRPALRGGAPGRHGGGRRGRLRDVRHLACRDPLADGGAARVVLARCRGPSARRPRAARPTTAVLRPEPRPLLRLVRHVLRAPGQPLLARDPRRGPRAPDRRPGDEPWLCRTLGIGFTDVVKRPTGSIDELRPDEWEAGAARVRALLRRHRPAAMCFVGLRAARAVLGPNARPGPWAERLEGVPAFALPATSRRQAAYGRRQLLRLFRHLAAWTGNP